MITLMMKIIFLFFFLKKVKSQTGCLVYDQIYTSNCLACKFGFNYENFSTASPNIKNFSIFDCQLNSNETFAKKEIYVVNTGCNNSQVRDGSHDFPFCNFSEALLAGQAFSQTKNSSKIKFLFIFQEKNNNNSDKQFFWDSEDLNTVYHFFRRVNVSITIKPLYCIEKNLTGCFKNTLERPILFLRTERHFLFVTSNFVLENIILDGFEIAFGNLNNSIKSSFTYTTFCNNTMSSQFYNPNNELSEKEKADICYFQNKSISPTLKKFAIFNIEPIFDCENCLKQPSSIFIKNCEFRHMHSFSEKISSLAAIFSAQRLKFSLKIETSTFLKLNLPEGIFTSFGGNIPEIYKTTNDAYLTAVGNQILINNENFILINKSSVSLYNYFNVTYATQLPGIFSIECLSHKLIIVDSYFYSNAMEPNIIRTMFYVNIPLVEPDIYFSLLFSSNSINKNRMNSIFEFSRVNLNPSGTIYLGIFTSNKFLDNDGCGFNSSMMDINITNSVFSNIRMYFSFITMNIGRIYLYSAIFTGFNSIFITDPIIKFVGLSLASDLILFKTVTGSSLNLTLESVYIFNSSFIDLLSGIAATKFTLNYLKIYNSSFENIAAEYQSLFLGNVEDDFFCLDSNFEIIIIEKLFGFTYTRSQTLVNLKLKNITAKSIVNSVIFGEEVPVPVNTIKGLILTHSSLEDTFYSTNPIYTKSRANFTIEDCIFDNIRMNYLIHLMIVEVANITNCSFSYIETQTVSGVILSILGYHSTTLGEFTVKECNFIQNSGFLVAKFLEFTSFRKGIVKDSVFLGVDKNQAPTLIRAFIPPTYLEGFLKITKCLFQGLRGVNGGALSIELWSILNIDIDNCDFIENQAEYFAADIILDFSLQAPLFTDLTNTKMFINYNFGIRNNRFSHSRGQEGGSITLLENGQAYLYNNSFSDISADSGGCIAVKEKGQLIIMNNTLINISCQSDGAVIWGINSLIFVYSCYFKNTNAKTGGVIYLKNVTAEIYYSHFSNTSANIGGFLNAIYSNLKIKSIIIQQSKAKYRGGSVSITKGELILTNSTCSDSSSDSIGGVLYLEDSKTVYIRMLSIFLSYAQSDGILYILGQGSKKYYFENITCYKTSSSGNGDCFYFSNTNSITKSLNLNKIKSINSVIYVNGDLLKSAVELYDTVIIDSSVQNSIFKSYNGDITLRSLKTFNIQDTKLSASLFILEASKAIFSEFLFIAGTLSVSSANVILAEKSNLEVKRLLMKLEKSFGGFHILSCTEIKLYQTLIIQASPSLGGLTDGGALYSKSSNIILINSKIINSNAGRGAAIYSEDSNMTLYNILMSNNEAKFGGSLVYSINYDSQSYTFINIEDLLGIDNKQNELFFIDCQNISIKNSKFYQNKISSADENSQVLKCQDVNLLYMNNITITGYSGLSPLTFLTLKSDRSSILIDNIGISECDSSESGGGIQIKGSIDGTIRNSIFSELKTRKSGGAISFSCPKNDCEVLIENNTFQNIIAKLYGAVFKIEEPGMLLSESNYYNENSAGLGNLTVGFPSKIRIILDENISDVNEALMKFKKHELNFSKSISVIGQVVSGKPIALIGLILDDNDNPLLLDDIGIVTVSSDDRLTYFENEYTYVHYGFLILNNLKIRSPPDRSIEIKLEYFNQNTKKSFSQTMTLIMRRCVRGEIILGTSCQVCTKGYYSLEDDPLNKSLKACSICPPFSRCPGGHQIIPLPGYWRKDENQTLLVSCPNKEGCPGGASINGTIFNPICSIGYKGYLCTLCEQGYGLDSSRKCVKCSENFFHYIKYFLCTLLSLFWIIYQAHMASKINTAASQSRALIKILVDHLSYVSFIASFRIEWASTVSDIVSIGDQYLSSVPSEMFNFDCFIALITEMKDRFVINFIIVSLTPILYGLFCSLIMYSILKIKKNCRKPLDIRKGSEVKLNTEEDKCIVAVSQNTNGDEPINEIKSDEVKFGTIELPLPSKTRKYSSLSMFIAMIMIIFYNFYPRIMLNSIQLFVCIKVDNSSRAYMERDTQIECWQPNHKIMIITMTLSSLIFWGVATPILLYLLTKKVKKAHESTKNYHLEKLFQFITLDYKERFYYWDILSYFSKLVISLLSLLASSLENSTQGSLLIFLFLFLFLLQERVKPYSYDFLNNLKTLSYITTITSAAFAMMASSNDIANSQKLVCIAFSLSGTFLFYIIWIIRFVRVRGRIFMEPSTRSRNK